MAVVVALALLLGAAVPASGATGYSPSDFWVTRVVADVGATVSVQVQGTIDRQLHAAFPGLEVSTVVALAQTCLSVDSSGAPLTATASPLTARTTSLVQTKKPVRGQLTWTVGALFDPAVDEYGSSSSPTAPRSICPAGYAPAAPATVTSLRLVIWPGSGTASAPLTTSGELLVFDATYPTRPPRG